MDYHYVYSSSESNKQRVWTGMEMRAGANIRLHLSGSLTSMTQRVWLAKANMVGIK